MKTSEKRVVNIDKEDFDRIKKYCDENAYNMSKWLVKIALENINYTHIETLDKGNGKIITLKEHRTFINKL